MMDNMTEHQEKLMAMLRAIKPALLEIRTHARYVRGADLSAVRELWTLELAEGSPEMDEDEDFDVIEYPKCEISQWAESLGKLALINEQITDKKAKEQIYKGMEGLNYFLSPKLGELVEIKK